MNCPKCGAKQRVTMASLYECGSQTHGNLEGWPCVITQRDQLQAEVERKTKAMYSALDSLNVHAFDGLGVSSGAIDANNALVKALEEIEGG